MTLTVEHALESSYYRPHIGAPKFLILKTSVTHPHRFQNIDSLKSSELIHELCTHYEYFNKDEYKLINAAHAIQRCQFSRTSFPSPSYPSTINNVTARSSSAIAVNILRCTLIAGSIGESPGGCRPWRSFRAWAAATVVCPVPETIQESPRRHMCWVSRDSESPSLQGVLFERAAEFLNRLLQL